MTSPTPAPTRSPRVDGSMSLLVDMMRDAQDPAYAMARQRARDAATTGTTGQRHPRRTAITLLALLTLGVATGAAAAELRGRVPGIEATRQELVDEVRGRTDDSDALEQRAAELRVEVDSRRAEGLALDAAGRQGAVALAAAQLAAAQTAVAGPGVVVTIDDRPEGAPETGLDRGGALGVGRVQDRDLQILVNGLWAAGAEAISVNDLRLTVRTAIRSAGEAVLVDFRPLSPPYVVRAIGAPGQLEPDFADSAPGRRIASYASVNNLPFSIRSEARIELPAGSGADLDVAEPLS